MERWLSLWLLSVAATLCVSLVASSSISASEWSLGPPVDPLQNVSKVAILNRLVNGPPPPPPQPTFIGFQLEADSESNEQARIIFSTSPAPPYVLTAYPDGILSLSYLRMNMLTAGVTRISEEEARQAAAVEEAYKNATAEAEEKKKKKEAPKFLEISEETALVPNDVPRVAKRSYKHEEKRVVFELNAKRANGEVEEMSEDEEDLLMQRHGNEDEEEAAPMSLLEVFKTEGKPDDKAKKPEAQMATFVYIPQLMVSGAFSADHQNMVVGSVPQWTLVQFDDFDDKAVRAPYSAVQTTICGGAGRILGGYCEFASEEVSRTVQKIPPHSQVAVEFNYYFIDRWLGEHGYFKVGNQILWTKQHKHCVATFQSNCRGINVCGDDKVADRVGEKVRVVFDHAGPALTFTFGSTLSQSPCIASYGVDNVAVYIRSPSVFA